MFQAPGNYEIFGWWRSHTTRVTNVTYNVFHNGTLTQNVPVGGVNQNVRAQWLSLGTYDFSGGGNEYIQLNATVSGDSKYTADAMKFAPGGSSTISIKNAHYYTYSYSESVPYLIVLDGSIKYYRFSQDTDDVSEAGLILDTTPPADVVSKNEDGSDRTYAQEIQNFANWFSFYRRRELTAKAAIARVIDGIQGVKVGFYSIWNRLNQAVLPVNVTIDGTTSDETSTLLDLLYGLNSSNGTPLRNALKNVGDYFDQAGGDGGIGSSPYAVAADGGACQQAFAIVVTDGFWNGSLSGIGNEDGDQGAPYADNWSGTLADVAMKYYKTDLSSTLANLVPANFPDMAGWQHMVTYGISFGVSGTLNPLRFRPLQQRSGPTDLPHLAQSDRHRKPGTDRRFVARGREWEGAVPERRGSEKPDRFSAGPHGKRDVAYRFRRLHLHQRRGTASWKPRFSGQLFHGQLVGRRQSLCTEPEHRRRHSG